jgi:ribose transport system permease protein
MAVVIASARSRSRQGLSRFVARNSGALVSGVLLVVLLAIYQVQAGKILSPIQIQILLNGALALVWAALGLTFVVVAGGFDLSIGSLMSLANVLAATFLAGTATDPLVVVAILVIGGLAGLLNGFLIAVVRIQSIIVTLAAMFIWSGVALLIMPQPAGNIPGYFSDVVGGTLAGGIPVALVWLVAILLAIAFFRQSSAWSVLFAVGGDEVSARRSGVRVTRARLLAYAAAGVCYALAGLFLSAQSTGGDANIGNPFLLTTFAAVILGGTQLGGGRGTFLGSIFGAFVVATLGSVLLSLGVTSYWTDVFQGTVLILAVVAPILATRIGGRRASTGGR